VYEWRWWTWLVYVCARSIIMNCNINWECTYVSWYVSVCIMGVQVPWSKIAHCYNLQQTKKKKNWLHFRKCIIRQCRTVQIMKIACDQMLSYVLQMLMCVMWTWCVFIVGGLTLGTLTLNIEMAANTTEWKKKWTKFDKDSIFILPEWHNLMLILMSITQYLFCFWNVRCGFVVQIHGESLLTLCTAFVLVWV
jgi:hypothetical protein